MGIEVAHVEAGLRSFDLSMPEEINRMVTDAISDYFFVTEKSGVDNLRKEGKPEGRIFFVGHVMIDTLLFQRGKLEREALGVRSEVDPDEIEKKKALHGARVHPVEFARGGSKLKAQSLKLKAQRLEEKEPYAVVTLHRPANVDDRETFSGIMEALIKISEDMPIIFPVHPRTRKIIEQFGLLECLNDAGITLTKPLAYMDFLRIWKDASLVLTDSGGLQEETTALGIPCFTIRENTERPVTIEEGTNTLVGTTKQGILSAYKDFRNGTTKKGRVPELWDGKAAERIVGVLVDRVRREV
jgi:UDP-N-acetylglucosamine 2-epimerase (non-hydrolysing)